MQIRNVVIDVEKTLGKVKFLGVEEKSVYGRPNEKVYVYKFTSSKLKSQFESPRKTVLFDIPFEAEIDFVGDVFLVSSVGTRKYGDNEVNTVEHLVDFTEISYKGANGSKPQTPPTPIK